MSTAFARWCGGAATSSRVNHGAVSRGTEAAFKSIEGLLEKACSAKRQGLLRPVNAKLLGWESVCFEVARWPWVVWAVIDAFRVTISKSHLTWRITPKDSKRRTAVPIRFLIPYLLIIFFCGVAAVVYEPNPATGGYFWFTLFNAVCYLVLLTVILYFNARESSTTESIAMP